MDKTITEEYSTPDGETVATEVYFEGDDPPEALQQAVEAAVRATIMTAMDGRRLVWREVDRGWRLVFGDGVPELLEMPDDGGTEPVALPRYQTEERFLGADGSSEGLRDQLPAGWGCGIESTGEYTLYRED